MIGKKPDWLKIKLRSSKDKTEVEEILKRRSLNTVCKEANCPNLMECYNKKTATFMILGSVCTRNCSFCGVAKGMPSEVDKNEPRNIAAAVGELGLFHAVITSVTRDDLPDGGAGHFADVIKKIKGLNKKIVVEVLVPDFSGRLESIKIIAESGPDIVNHNIETVPRLYPSVRPGAIYERSLMLLKNIKSARIYTKSGIMLGLGERREEVVRVMSDLREAGCEMLTVGQYLAPSKEHQEVFEYVDPAVFDMYGEIGRRLGFLSVASGPLIRSSYNSGEFFDKLRSSL
jgi:lipoic acid synthetase